LKTINLYCDESSHLNYKDENVMGFAEIECDYSKIKEVNSYLKELKRNFNISEHQELKWSKVSKSNLKLYKSFINYFFIDDDLRFRATIIKDKTKLKFTETNTKSDFYYKMLYLMIIRVVNPANQYNIYLDIKDTNSAKKINTLQNYLNSTKIEYNVTNTILKVQTIRSYESNLLQLADILLGAIIYHHKKEFKNEAKKELVEYIKSKSYKSLDRSTLSNELKFNLFISDANRMKLRGEDEL